jgi:hypothetical protein
VEVGEALTSLDFVDTELDLAEGVVFILVKIGKRQLDDTSLEVVVAVSQTLGTVDQSFTDVALSEHGRSLEVIPILAREWVDAEIVISTGDCVE